MSISQNGEKNKVIVDILCFCKEHLIYRPFPKYSYLSFFNEQEKSPLTCTLSKEMEFGNFDTLSYVFIAEIAPFLKKPNIFCLN